MVPIDPIPIIVGILAGFVGSLLGVGGGSIITPLLVALGYNIKTVIPASLLSIVGTSLGGLDVYDRENLIDYRVGLRLEATAVIGSILGVHAAIMLEPRILKIALGLVLGYIGVTSIRQAISNVSGNEVLSWSVSVREIVGAAAGVLKGFMSALVGIGGGVLGVPILHKIIGLDMKKSIATSKMLVGMTAAAGVLGYAIKGALDPCLGINLSLGTIVGGLIGSKMGVRLSNRTAKLLFAGFLLVMSMLILSGKR